MTASVFAPDALGGRVALITGGGSGIGFGIATAMVKAGAKIVIASRNLAQLDTSAAVLRSLGGEVATVKTDVRSAEEVANAVTTAVDSFGSLDIIVANAAGNFVVPTAEMSINAWRVVIDIDLNGTFYCAKAAYPYLKNSKFGGRLLAISTMRAMEGWPGCAHAGAAKAGIMSLMRSLSAEWGRDGILCNTIAPGAIGNTEGVKKIYEDQDVASSQLAQIPLGRMGMVEDIAAAAVYLCSDAGAYVTGTDLVVDGGRQRRMQEVSFNAGPKSSMTKTYPHVETERDGPVLIVRLDNAHAKNALSREMRFSLRDITREIADDRTVRSVYLTAKGDSFCAGGDLNMLVNANKPWEVHRRFRHANTLFPPLLTLDRPVVCGVRGYAVGGGMGLALMADLIVAGDSAKFMAGFFRLGAVPDCLTLYTLPRLVGLAKARNFLLTNGTWNAKEAAELGVAAKVVADDQVDAEALALAHKLASGPAEIIGLAKLLLLQSFEKGIDETMLFEDLAQALAMSGAEFQEGLSALKAGRRADQLKAALDDPTNNGLPA